MASREKRLAIFKHAYIVLFAILLSCSFSAEAREYYIAADGSDKWSGEIPAPNNAKTNGPFATFEHVKEVVRKEISTRPKEPVTVWVRSGVYSLTRTFELGPGESGRPDAPVTFRAYKNEHPVINGMRIVKGFKPYKDMIFKADVAVAGLSGIYFRQLFFMGERQHLARYPNVDFKTQHTGGWTYVSGIPVPPFLNRPGDSKSIVRLKLQDLHKWAHPDDGEVFIFPRYNWINNILPIASVDQSGQSLNLAGDASYEIRPGDRYFVRNLFEELDAPGEWFLDRRTLTLYFWPPVSTMNSEELSVSVPTLEPLVHLSGASNIAFRGFTIEGTDGSAIVLNDSIGCLIAENIIRNIGGRFNSQTAGVVVRGGKNNGIVGNDIYQVGSNAIILAGGDRQSLSPAGNYADNNYIHNTGIYYKQGVGIYLDGVGNTVSHNLIHSTPRMGILINGNDHIIEYNHIHHTNLETADTGAIYTGGRDWLTPRGTVIRYNYIHDSIGYGFDNGKWVSPHYSWGIYLDDNASGVDIIGNIITRAQRGLLMLHNARDNYIENNIFIDGDVQQIELIGWKKKGKLLSDFLPGMIKSYETYSLLPAWSKYRGFVDNSPLAAIPMAGNKFSRNIYYYRGSETKLFNYLDLPYEHFSSDYNLIYHDKLPILFSMTNVQKGKQWLEWTKKGFDQHSVIADPLFVDVDHGDYRLKSASPAYKLGFKPIPFDKIGPYQDALRATWPVR